MFLKSPWILYGWLIPCVFVAEPIHFFIELPEHYGLNTQTNPDVFSNTRTILHVSSFFRWFTNYNDLHTAHHFLPMVPMENLPALQPKIEHWIKPICKEETYFEFINKIIRGVITVKPQETCMN
jgi:fatty acid desaturase